MPFAILFIGLVLVVTGVKGTIRPLGQQLVKDFTGPGNFFYWFLTIGALGALGSVPQFRQFSRVFMALVLIAMVIRNGGVFDRFIEAIETGPIAPERAPAVGEGVQAAGEVFEELKTVDALPVLSPINLFGNYVQGVQALAQRSVAQSGQQSTPADNLNALTRLLNVFR